MRTKRQALQWGLKFLSPYSLLLLFLLIPTLTSAIEGRVVKVKDGDTVVIAPIDGGQFFVCRLYGIDAPEHSGQPYGEEATLTLKRMILGLQIATS